MAYVFGFPKEVTRLIYDMRDWKLEDVKQNNGTQSCLALKPFRIWQQPFRVPNTYKLLVIPKNRSNEEVWIVALFGLGFRKTSYRYWKNHDLDQYHDYGSRHGSHVSPCLYDYPYNSNIYIYIPEDFQPFQHKPWRLVQRQ